MIRTEVYIPTNKYKYMNILQKTIGYIAAPISLIQLFRPVVLGITIMADISSNGKAPK